jgi:2-succinyl-6-hydroxy-2,4-cyclohexadiene-1-carboxylate synthase
MIPGFTLPSGSWDPVIKFFLPDWDVQAFDIPDGLDFVATAETLGHRGAQGVWVGYSLGARLALCLALNRPETVERLVLISSTAGIESSDDRRARTAADNELAVSIESNGVDIFLEQWLDQRLFETLPAEVAQLSERKRVATAHGLIHQLLVLGQGVQEPLWGRLGELDLPVLIIAGQWDRAYTRTGQRLQEAIGDNATLAVIPSASHAVHLEQPEAVAHEIAAWLAAAE